MDLVKSQLRSAAQTLKDKFEASSLDEARTKLQELDEDIERRLADLTQRLESTA